MLHSGECQYYAETLDMSIVTRHLTIYITVGALEYDIEANAMLKSEGTIEVLLCMKGAFDLCR